MFGLDLSPEGLLTFFSAYAYEPTWVYTFIVIFMFASSFGFPAPEELVLVSSGLVAYLAQNPQDYPPPYEGAVGVNVYTLMVVCFLAVFLSDFLVYCIGKFLGDKLMKYPYVQKQMEGKTYATIQTWFNKYGSWCCGMFRFTPGLRFPGHLSCGILGIPMWKFVTIDGFMALISVPTQVWFVATYGKVIVERLQAAKFYMFGAFFVIFMVWFVRKKIKERREFSAK
ncbi:MAG: VTT domain-containing protein [Proteobacteria bacterium]|nr:VTT domain-containing protein [Pseudomonadota bacterium]